MPALHGCLDGVSATGDGELAIAEGPPADGQGGSRHSPDRSGGVAVVDRPDLRPPGRRYSFGWGSSSRKLTGPAIAAADLGPIDAVLLSHDHHGDNLDTTGRALLPGSQCRPHHHRRGPPARGQRPGPPTLGDHPAGGPGAARHPGHGHPLPPRAAAQPAHRRRGDRLRPGLGGPGPWGSVDHRRHRAVRRRPPGRRPPPSGHRPCSTSAAYASRSPGRSATP
jgi:hypothetical protein